jgi:phosphoglycerate dehydrogenase-like enzyme
MHVLISIQQRVPQWQIPEATARALMARYPAVQFTYATTDEMRREGLRTADVAFTWMLGEHELAEASRLQWVHTSAVAVETLCLPALTARGIRVSNTRGVQAVPIAEHVLAMLLAFGKQLPFLLERQREARWAQADCTGPRLPWLLQGRTLALVGLGTIGEALAVRASALGMRVIAQRRDTSRTAAAGVSAVFGPAALHEMLAQADAVVVAAPLTPATAGMFDAAAFAAMRQGSVFVNVGRARIVDTAALVAALERGHLAGASLDVFPEEPLPQTHPLWRSPNVILTPHTSGFRHGHWDDVADVFADNLDRYLTGRPLRFEVQPDRGY